MSTEEPAVGGALTARTSEDAAVRAGSGKLASAAAGLMTRAVDGLAAHRGGGTRAAAVALAGLG